MPESIDDKIKRMASAPGGRSDPQFESWLRDVDARNRYVTKNNMFESLANAAIAGGLGFWAYWSIAHAVLFAFIGFSIFAVGNRVISYLRKEKLDLEKERHLDRLYGPSDR